MTTVATKRIAHRPGTKRRRIGTVSRRTLALFLLPFFLLFTAFYVLPVMYAVIRSFEGIQRSAGMFGTARTTFVGLAQYGAVLADGEFWAGLGRIGLFGVFQVPTMLLLSLVLALLLDSGVIRKTAFLRLAPFVPYAVPGVIAAITWSFFYHPTLSPFTSLLNDVGIKIDFFSSSVIVFSLANIATWLWAGYNMLLILAALQAVPTDIFEAARLDGASNVRIALSIKIPMVRPAITMSAIFSIIGTLQLFTEPTVLQNIAPTISSTFTPNMMAYSLAHSCCHSPS